MYNDAYVSALNADRERFYAQLERERRQDDIDARRLAADAGERACSQRVPRSRRGGSLRLAHAGR